MSTRENIRLIARAPFSPGVKSLPSLKYVYCDVEVISVQEIRLVPLLDPSIKHVFT